MIDWAGTYIITYSIIFGMKKGYTRVTRQVPKGEPPPPLPPDLRKGTTLLI